MSEAALIEDIAGFYDDPLGFVLYAFDWTNDSSIQHVELVEPWASRYNSKYGPDAWACRFLDEVGDNVRSGASQRHATSSGHGIGKSTLTAWLILWIMSTRPHCKGVVTANTAEQLASKTWAELSKWLSKSVTAHWFRITTSKGSLRLVHVESPETWRCDAQTCREENSESFAGLHAADSTPFYIFDEASAIPDKIWEVAEGGQTDGEPMWFVFGNPTRNTGKFFECFNRFRHRWTTRQIDSRDVQITNKEMLNQWVEDYGEESDFVKVRVRGVFPSASSLQFIPRDLVDQAMSRIPDISSSLQGRTAVVGVDVARFGDDCSVIRTRIGRDCATWEPRRYRKLDTMQLAARVIEHLKMLENAGYSTVTFVDGGGVGGGVIDRLRDLNCDVIEVNFGGKADDQRLYANKRAEIWGRMREWLPTGCLNRNADTMSDLTGVEYGYNSKNQILLESKESMKKRGLASPDDGDAIALTFAQPVPEFAGGESLSVSLNPKKARDYDPYQKI